MPSRCHCCPSSPKEENYQHLFIESELASRVWGFFAPLLELPHPTSLQHLFDYWLIGSSTSSQIGCTSILVVCCCLWEIWCYRNRVRHDSRSLDPIQRVRHWLVSLDFLIRPSIRPSSRDSAILASLRITARMVPAISGSWRNWQPHAQDLTLCLASYSRGHSGGFIFRGPSLALALAGGIRFQIADPVGLDLHVLLRSLMLARERHFIIGAIHCSSPSMCDIIYGRSRCPWAFTYILRQIRDIIGDTRLSVIPKELNRPARILASLSIERTMIHISELPSTVRDAIVEDRTGDPIYCRQ